MVPYNKRYRLALNIINEFAILHAVLMGVPRPLKNYGMIFVTSKQVSLPKVSLILEKLKIGPKSDLSPFCRKAFNYVGRTILFKVM